MTHRRSKSFIVLSLVALAAVVAWIQGGAFSRAAPTPALAEGAAKPELKARVYELRTYTTNPGRLDALHKRFREHTNYLFVKHGMTLVGYWTPVDKPDTLVYLLAHASREAAAQSFKAFGADSEWQRAREESEKDGKIVVKVESQFLEPTDYSPLR
jgi:hypothetical protein